MSIPRTYRWSTGLRWAACFVIVLGVHVTAAAALLTRSQPADEPVAGGPAILIDLARVAAAPQAPPTEAAPGPQQMQAAPQPIADPVDKREKPQVTAAITPPVETPPLPEAPPAVADVTLPLPRPPQKAAEHKQQKHQPRLADLNSAPAKTERSAPHAVAPAPGAASHNPDAVPNWKSEVVARLERYKRYPSEAEARGEQGVSQLAFSVDRTGGVHNARIVRSSGSSLLDRATLDLIARAQPLPPPPPELRGVHIAITVPINYNLRTAR